MSEPKVVQLTEQQVNERFAELGMRFSSYYKYSFTYVAKAEDGTRIQAVYGGNQDDIYRYEVTADGVRPFESCGYWLYVFVDDAAGQRIFDWHNAQG